MVADQRRLGLRNSSNFRLPQHLIKSAQNNIFYNGLRDYNALPTEIKNSVTSNDFKQKCILYVKQHF